MTTFPCTLRLLGRVELRDSEGALLPLKTRKTALALAMLALEGTMRRDDLAGAVWEGVEETSAREGLRTALSALRKVLPEQAIRTEGDRLGLDDVAVRVEPFRAEDGDFMPGCESDWAIDRRLAVRAEFVAEALDSARSARRAGHLDVALASSERACALDPLDNAAATLRIELLRETGRVTEAISRGDAYRARVVRAIGILPEDSSFAVPAENPLVAAVEWALARDPEEACAILAGTQRQWFALSVERALEIHRRVLEATSRPSAARRSVEIGRSYFAALVDPVSALSGSLEQLYRDAVERGETAAADPLCEALAYGSLSLGDFEGAVAYAREGVSDARRRGDSARMGRWGLHRGIIAHHAGDLTACYRHVDRAVVQLEESGSVLEQVGAEGAQIGYGILRGKLDEAAASLEVHRRRTLVYGSERMVAWTFDLEGLLYARECDWVQARAAYARFRELAPAAGQCAVAAADDGLMRAECALGEYGPAADALARNVVYRRRKGSVASVFERAANRPIVRTLRERIGESDLAAAFRRAAQPL